jgi:VanZ family protein
VRRRFFAFAFVGYGLLIALLSLSPPSAAGALVWDKAVHAAAYLIFVLLGTPLLASSIAADRRRQLWWLAAGVFGYGVLIEVGQYFVPGRFMSAGDVVANGLGVVLGLGLVWYKTGLLKCY